VIRQGISAFPKLEVVDVIVSGVVGLGNACLSELANHPTAVLRYPFCSWAASRPIDRLDEVVNLGPDTSTGDQ
jgi:hypothetical protein